MIKTWRDEAARELFVTRKSRKVAQNIQKVAIRKMGELDAAKSINDLRANPGNHLNFHIRGNFKGFWTIRINNQWRLFFRWENDNAYDVEIADDHSG
jgi:proteic killer suppression protein